MAALETGSQKRIL